MSGLPYQQHSYISRSRSLAPTPPPTSEAGFGNQGLTTSNQTRGYSVPSSYQYQQPQPQHISNFVTNQGPSIPTTSFLPEPFQSSTYPTLPSQSYSQQPLRYSAVEIPRVSHSPSNHLEQAEQVSAIPHQVSGADMRY